jgi:ribosomal-protein-alanine N-acetyltransferase
MIIQEVLNGKRVTLKQLALSDLDDVYISWLHDPRINQFLEVRRSVPTLLEQREYVESIQRSENRAIFGIFLKGRQLIGSLSLTRYEQNGLEIGIMIGDIATQGKGFGKEAILLILDWSRKIGVNEVLAKYIKQNEASSALFRSCGFKVTSTECYSDKANEEEIVATKVFLT